MIKEIMTTDEIMLALHETKNIPIETAHKISAFIDGATQAAYNILRYDNFDSMEVSKLVGWPDNWERGYNAILQIYQDTATEGLYDHDHEDKK